MRLIGFMARRMVLGAGCAGLLLGGRASAAPPSEPMLRLEVGAHTAVINRIDADAQGRFLVTGSDDKTARVWSVADGRLLRILRPPAGAGKEGMVYAVAIAPDGGAVAVGGWTGEAGRTKNIYLFDRASGQIIHRISGLPNVVLHLTFSPDGRFLAACLGGANGLRVYGTTAWQLVAEDLDYGGHSYSAHFDSTGRLVTTSYDGFIRLYGSDFALLAKEKASGGERPFAARFSPDGEQIAVGFQDTTAVEVLDGRTLRRLYTPDTDGVDNGNLPTVAWSADSRFLYAGGRYDDGTGANPIRRWDSGGRGTYEDFAVSDDTILDLHALEDGRIAYGAADPVFGVLDSSGRKQWDRPTVIADFRDNESGFLLSRDGRTVQFGFEQRGKRPARFSLDERTLRLDPDTSAVLHPPRTQAPDLDIDGWKNTYNPTLNGAALALKEYETSFSLSIAPDGRHFLLGTHWYLRYFDAEGDQLWEVAAPGAAWAVNITPDGQVAVAAFADGTLRWYDLDKGRELLALFPHNDGQRWVLWNQEGFFDAAGGGADLIGYHLNNGPDQAADFVEVDRLYELFYRPDLVAAHLDGRPQDLQAALVNVGDVRQVLAGGLPPEVEVVGPAEQTLDDGVFILHLQLVERGGGVGDPEYRVNGVNITQALPEGRLTDVRGPQGQPRMSQPIPRLAPGANTIEVRIPTADGGIASKPARVVVHVPVDAAAEGPPDKPGLYVLAVGINAYRDQSIRLKYATQDARAVAATLAERGRALFEPVEQKVLVDRAASLAGIQQAFAELVPQMEPDDVFVLYMAGHGRSLDGRYHFIPQDVIYRNDRELAAQSLTHARLDSLLAEVPAQKSLLILDTCNAGAYIDGEDVRPEVVMRDLGVKTAIGRLMRSTGRAVLAASTSSQMALAGYKGHGVFTYALLQGLRGAANGDRARPVTVDELSAFLDREVPRITEKEWGHEQFPMRDLQGHSFPITWVE